MVAVAGFFIIIVLVVLVLIWIFNAAKNAQDTNNQVADIKNGKGVFLTFNYSPEEWEYFTRNLVLSGKQGKAFFGKKLILLADGTEDIITELFELDPRGQRLQQVKIDQGFLVFSIKYRDIMSENEAGLILRSDTNEFQILIPSSQMDDANRLLDFYQKLITNNNDKRDELTNNI